MQVSVTDNGRGGNAVRACADEATHRATSRRIGILLAWNGIFGGSDGASTTSECIQTHRFRACQSITQRLTDGFHRLTSHQRTDVVLAARALLAHHTNMLNDKELAAYRVMTRNEPFRGTDWQPVGARYLGKQAVKTRPSTALQCVGRFSL